MLRTLGQLAARELGLARNEPAAALAPRLPSRYEQADAAPAAAAAREEAPHDAAAVVFHGHTTSIQNSDRLANSSPRTEVASPTAGELKRAGGEARARAQPEGDAEPDRRELPAEAIKTVHDTGRDAPPVRPAATAPPPQEPLSRVRNDAIPSLPVAAVRDAAVSTRVGKREMETQRAAARAHAESHTQPREASALRPLAPAPLPPRAAASAAAAAPPVHVTIGRLEIRATTEAAPAVAPAPRAATTPSLASYLRRRSDGRRS